VAIGGDPARLIALYEAAHREGANRRRHRQPSTEEIESIDLEDRPNRVFVEMADSMYYVNELGVITEARFVLSVRAKQPDVTSFRTLHSYNFDPRRGVLTIEAGIGCTIYQIREAASGAIDVIVNFDRALQPTDREAHVVSYRLLIDSDKPAEPMVVYEPSGQVTRYTARVQFVDPNLVEEVRWFVTRSNTEMRTSQDPAKVFSPQPSGYYIKEFTDLMLEWAHGIAWKIR
jgi:hypothetical protein